MADPVSWLMIEPGWRVIAADDQQVGRVEEVTGDSNSDIFDGLAVASTLWAHQRYVAAESVGQIFPGEVYLLVDAAAMEGLPEYKEPAEEAEIESEKASFLQREEEHIVHTPTKPHDTSLIHRVLEWFGLAGKR
jgi:hypothetical protein